MIYGIFPCKVETVAVWGEDVACYRGLFGTIGVYAGDLVYVEKAKTTNRSHAPIESDYS